MKLKMAKKRLFLNNAETQMGDDTYDTSAAAPDAGPAAAPRKRSVVAPHAFAATINIPSTGTVLCNRYELLEEIGRGAMGVVFKALDKSLDNNVAIKILPPELANSKKAIANLKQEAKLAMKLRHPSIMGLHNFEDSDVCKFLVMELLQGETLEEYLLREEKAPLPVSLDLARYLGEALDYAHFEKVIHRDIKPANIFYDQRNQFIRPRLTDFGIARQMRESMSRLTHQDVSGTLLYMSPEQLQGEDIDGRADVYSLAATIYEMMAGHPPFYRGDISYQIINKAPPPIDKDLYPEAQKVLFKALAKDPNERWPNGRTFAAHLIQTALTYFHAEYELAPVQEMVPGLAQQLAPKVKLWMANKGPRRLYDYPEDED